MLIRTRAVFDKTVKDLENLLFLITIFVQLIFFVFYGYSIFKNTSHPLFLITYIALTVLSATGFAYYLITYKKRADGTVKAIKLFFRFAKYIVNLAMLSISIVEYNVLGGTDITLLLIILSGISLAIQLTVEILRACVVKYSELFLTALQMDFAPITKLSKATNVLDIIDAPLEMISNKIEGKSETLSSKEKYINELTDDFKLKIKEKKRAKKEQTDIDRKKEIKNHLKIISNALFNKRCDEEKDDSEINV